MSTDRFRTWQTKGGRRWIARREFGRWMLYDISDN